jgi:large subunit ribosomal protein L21
MYAIVYVGGEQEKVGVGDIILSDKIKAEKGDIIKLDKVLLVSKGKKVEIGTPYIKNAKVEAEILGGYSGKKITVFRYKRRKDSSRKLGYRQKFLRLKVKSISGIEAGSKKEKEKDKK